MKHTRLAAALTAFAGLNAWAVAADAQPFYAKFSAGMTEAEVEGLALDEGANFGAALGTALGPFRVEAGADRLSGEFGGGFAEIDAIDWRAGAYLDLPIGDNASVFVGAGLDYIDGEATAFGNTIDASGSGYSLAAGGAYRLNDRVIAEAQWRRIEADLESDFGDIDAQADVFSVGLRLKL